MFHQASITTGGSLFLQVLAIKHTARKLVVGFKGVGEGEKVSSCLRGDETEAQKDR